MDFDVLRSGIFENMGEDAEYGYNIYPYRDYFRMNDNGTETQLTGELKNAGRYKVTLTCGDGKNRPTVSLYCEIEKAAPIVTWDTTSETVSLYYTGEPISLDKLPALTVTGVDSEGNVTSKYTNDDFTYYYRESADEAFTEGLPTNLGEYEIKATVKAKGNYTDADAKTTEGNYLTLKFGWLDTEETATLTDQNGNSLTGNDWWAQSVTFTAPSGFTISRELNGSYDSSFLYDAETGTSGTEITYYLKNSNGEIAKKSQIVHIDSTAPTFPSDGGIQIKDNWFKSLLNTITFNLLYKENVDVTVKAEDALSGIASYYYWVDTSGSTAVLTAEELSEKTFTKTDNAKIATTTQDGKYVYYVYVEDKAGNRSSYICSNGVVVDTAAPEVSVTTDTQDVTATPTVATTPTVEGVVNYHPEHTLSGIDLMNGAVTGVDGSPLQGRWSWETPGQVPQVNNSGYRAIFTPSDSNYETVDCTITVTVVKATPYIATAPSASAITYGEMLSSSSLANGTVQYSENNSTLVEGNFVWQKGNIRPTAKDDSNTTRYTVIFKPTDNANYNQVETEITIRVNKAAYPSNKPSDTMSVANSCRKVGSAPLPSGWAWKEEDKDTELEVGGPVTATAVYVGADKDNYIEDGLETSVTITRKAAISSGSGSGSSSSNGSDNGSSTVVAPQPTPVTPQPTPPVTQSPLPKPILPDNGKRPDKAPFIKGENGKEGWDVIRTETEGTPEGSTVTVDMNGASVVPSAVLSDIKGRNVTLVFDMGNGITWSVNGMSITGEAIGSIDFGVKTGAQAGKTIPVDVLNNITGERTSLNVTLAYDGEFGFTAVLSINMKSENAGLYANLFYYNESTGELEFICCDRIREDGTTDLTFTHASDYTIVVDSVPMDGSAKADDAVLENGEDSDGNDASAVDVTENTITTDNASAWNPLWFVLIGVVVIVVGLGIFLITKKKQGEE